MKIQFAFQGGGARLAILLPVVDALQQLERDGVVQITRVAGTSAGAIAAVLLAKNANMRAVQLKVAEVAKDRARLERVFPPIASASIMNKVRYATKLLAFNKPLGDDRELSKLIEEVLEAAGLEHGIHVGQRDARDKPCFLVSADVSRYERIEAGQEETVVRAIMESAALPFLFRTTGDRIDGGILDNLPVEALLTPESPDNEHGNIVAVAFAEEAYASPVRSALGLAGRLLDTMITYRTKSTRRLLGAENVMELPTDVGGIVVESFDVDAFVRFVQDQNAVARVREQAKAWVVRYVQRAQQLQQTSVQISLDAPSTSDERRQAETGNLKALAEAYHQHPTLEVVESILEVVAYGLDASMGPRQDTVRFIDRFRTGAKPVHMYAVRGFSSTAPDSASKDLKIFDSHKRPVPFVSFGVVDELNGAKWTLICFLEPLPPSSEVDEVYTIIIEQEVDDAMQPLAADGADYLAIQVNQAVVAVSAEIRLCVPLAFGALALEQGTMEAMRSLQHHADALATAERRIIDGVSLDLVIEACPPGYRSYTWRGENCGRGELLRVIFRRMTT